MDLLLHFLKQEWALPSAQIDEASCVFQKEVVSYLTVAGIHEEKRKKKAGNKSCVYKPCIEYTVSVQS